MKCRRSAIVLCLWCVLGWLGGGCDLVLGIDDVSSAEGPDGGDRGQRISGQAAEPDASADASDPAEDAGRD